MTGRIGFFIELVSVICYIGDGIITVIIGGIQYERQC